MFLILLVCLLSARLWALRSLVRLAWSVFQTAEADLQAYSTREPGASEVVIGGRGVCRAVCVSMLSRVGVTGRECPGRTNRWRGKRLVGTLCAIARCLLWRLEAPDCVFAVASHPIATPALHRFVSGGAYRFPKTVVLFFFKYV